MKFPQKCQLSEVGSATAEIFTENTPLAWTRCNAVGMT